MSLVPTDMESKQRVTHDVRPSAGDQPAFARRNSTYGLIQLIIDYNAGRLTY